MAQKFIITQAGYFRLGDVSMHKDLLLSGDECIGGGLYQFDYVNACLLLDGRSYDFGAPRWHFLEEDGISLKVPAAYRGLRIKYRYNNHYDEDYILAEHLKIEYV